MVDRIDIRKLNLEELAGVVNIFPWFAGARAELCARLLEMDACSDEQLGEAALYFGSRRIASDLKNRDRHIDCTDPDIQEAESAGVRSEPKRIFVVGGDYFSLKDYERARRDDDDIFSTFAQKNTVEARIQDNRQEECPEDIYTEALARIYLDQDYPEEAKKIYSKLSLRYPEKSVYFATLIDEIDKNYRI